ncbi:MAG: hypothetical protein V3T86_05880 [Planctomycetota bacterium]
MRILAIPVAGTLAAIAVSFAMANTTDPVLNDPGKALPRRTPRDSDNARRDVTPGDAEAAERVGDAYEQRLKEGETGAKREFVYTVYLQEDGKFRIDGEPETSPDAKAFLDRVVNEDTKTIVTLLNDPGVERGAFDAAVKALQKRARVSGHYQTE